MKSKKGEIRLQENLDAGEQMFSQKGYDETTINDVLSRVNIGKGTFYHYFDSKLSLMTRIIERMMGQLAQMVTDIANDPSLAVHDKMTQVLLQLNQSGSEAHGMIEGQSAPQNAILHQAGIVASVHSMTPILAKIIEQGIDEGVYHTPYPFETIEFILASNQFYFDVSAFGWQKEEMYQKGKSFIRIMTLSLGAKAGSFDFLLPFFETQVNKEMS